MVTGLKKLAGKVKPLPRLFGIAEEAREERIVDVGYELGFDRVIN